MTVSPQYINAVTVVITISTKKFFKCSIIVSSKFHFLSFGRSSGSLVAQVLSGEKVDYFTQYSDSRQSAV